MPKLLKKLVLSFFISLFVIPYSLFFNSVPSAHAQQTWYNQDAKDWYVRVYDSPPNDVFGERYTAAQIQWIFYGLFANALNAGAGLVGIAPKDIACIIKGGSGLLATLKNVFPTSAQTGVILTSCGIDKALRSVGLLAYKPDAANIGIAEFIFLRDRPLSGISYFRDVARNWHLIPEAQAQTAAPGFGFGALSPIRSLWSASRDVAYGILVLSILIIAFMIMFRVKINPQTVITVQSALPKIILALILITFSYAIAGFMVDLVYVVIGLLSLTFSRAWASINIPTLGLGTSTTDFFIYMVAGPGGTGIFGALGVYLAPLAIIIALSLGAGLLLSLGGATTIVGTIAGLIMMVIGLILFIAIIVFFIRVVWMLFKAFAYVVLLVAFAPIQIALGIIVPSFGFGQWLRSLAANLAVFPVTGLFLAVSFFFIGESLQTLLPSPNVPETTVGWPPLLNFGGGAAVALVYFGTSLMVFSLIPRVTEVIKGLIEGKPFAYGTAIGEAVAPARVAGLFGAAEGLNVIQRIVQGQNAQAPVPGWIQATRRTLGIKA